jgi:hypothetical protein
MSFFSEEVTEKREGKKIIFRDPCRLYAGTQRSSVLDLWGG